MECFDFQYLKQIFYGHFYHHGHILYLLNVVIFRMLNSKLPDNIFSFFIEKATLLLRWQVSWSHQMSYQNQFEIMSFLTSQTVCVHKIIHWHAWLLQRICMIRWEKCRSDSANTALYLQHLTEKMLINKTEPHILAYPKRPESGRPCHHHRVTDYSPVSYSLDFHCGVEKQMNCCCWSNMLTGWRLSPRLA